MPNDERSIVQPSVIGKKKTMGNKDVCTMISQSKDVRDYVTAMSINNHTIPPSIFDFPRHYIMRLVG